MLNRMGARADFTKLTPFSGNFFRFSSQGRPLFKRIDNRKVAALRMVPGVWSVWALMAGREKPEICAHYLFNGLIR